MRCWKRPRAALILGASSRFHHPAAKYQLARAIWARAGKWTWDGYTIDAAPPRPAVTLKMSFRFGWLGCSSEVGGGEGSVKNRPHRRLQLSPDDPSAQHAYPRPSRLR
ncbi:hypothetical protein SVAN01_05924 [Stagonosporopsis vannaccii]|nr:hypothetical protein SVAN01_05924 [Stagonosporopsis vannaccii]